MKLRRMLSVLLAAAMVFSLCAQASALDLDLDLPVEKEDSYPRSESGEVIINDVSFSSDYRTDDNNRVFYEIFVGSFSDSDGDGTGDLQGIINRLDYLNDGDPESGLSLGVEGIWLTPIFKSRSYHKYDVMDYYTIDPAFGDMETFKTLIDECHKRNIAVIIDLVINHTGTGNPWYSEFINAHRQGLTDSEWYDFYTYSAAGEPLPAGRSFSQISGTKDYYECNFSGDMPELNFDSEFVYQTMLDIALYYLDMGVDGFRFDAAKYIYFGDNAKSAAFWDRYIGELKAQYPDVYTVAEVWDSDAITAMYNSSTSCFNFTASQSSGLLAETAKAGDVNRYTGYLESYINRLLTANSDNRLCLFIANHDNDRAAGYLSSANGQIQMAANLYILTPGSPFIYYGEEIGMRGSRGGESTDANRRLAMLWGDGDTVADPKGSSYPASSQTSDTVSSMLSGGYSLYNYYKRLIMIRSANPEIARGEYKALSFEGTKTGGFICTYEGSSVAVIHNTSKSASSIDLAAAGLDGAQLSAYIGMGSAEISGTELKIEGQTSVVLRLG